MPESPSRPPRDNVVRAIYPGLELRADADDAPPTLAGHFAVFNRWTEIDSVYEGRFLERIAPGAFARTFNNNRDGIRVLFQHGRDPQIGDKPLGPISDLREDDTGAYYEVDLLDTTYNRELIPGLRAGLYGASFRFRVLKEDFEKSPKRTDDNPEGLPLRTIREAQVMEFGPVTFPAYADATAGIRSLTTEWNAGLIAGSDAGLTALATAMRDAHPELFAPGPAELPHSEDEDRDSGPAEQPHSEVREEPDPPPVVAEPKPTEDPVPAGSSAIQKETRTMNITEKRVRLDEIAQRFKEIHAEAGADALTPEAKSEWDGLLDERKRLEKDIADYEVRLAEIEHVFRAGGGEPATPPPAPSPYADRTIKSGSKGPANVYAVEEYRNFASSDRDLRQLYHDGAMRAIEIGNYAHERADKAAVQTHVERLLNKVEDEHSTFAKRILSTGSPAYKRAFGKVLVGKELTSEERTALSTTDAAGGFAVPYDLDPTIIPTSNGSVNPLRQISRVEQTLVHDWQGVSSAGITAAYATEAAEASDNAPVLVQPSVTVLRAQAFVPFSIEIGQDWGRLQSEMAALLQDAKDDLEATKFVLGTGTVEPTGIVAGLGTAYHVQTAASATFAVADVYSLENALPPRNRPLASVVANRAIYNLVRQFDTAGGAALWEYIGNALPARLLGYPAYEASAMSSTAGTADKIMVAGDFRNFLIVDRIGMNIELIPHLFGASNRYPTGQRGLYAIWRNSSVILNQNAFRLLKVKAS